MKLTRNRKEWTKVFDFEYVCDIYMERDVVFTVRAYSSFRAD